MKDGWSRMLQIVGASHRATVGGGGGGVGARRCGKSQEASGTAAPDLPPGGTPPPRDAPPERQADRCEGGRAQSAGPETRRGPTATATDLPPGGAEGRCLEMGCLVAWWRRARGNLPVLRRSALCYISEERNADRDDR